MYLIVALGNIGEKYKNNRHNVGFMVAKTLIKKFDFQKKGVKFKSALYEGNIAGEKVLLIKPRTYMNLSGEAVQLITGYFKIPKKNILVIYDDFDIPFGTIRIKPEGGAGTHNGIKSIIQLLGSNAFPRLRMGIGPLPENMRPENFVLADFSKAEKSELPSIMDTACDAIETVFTKGLDKAMNLFN
jgi:peptidyl-tRNA hydrolase, PTH1 family